MSLTRQSSITTSESADKLVDDILSEGDSYTDLKAVTVSGAHFQFKSEKTWILTDKPVNSRFRLHVPNLSENFASLPFNRRLSLYYTYCSEREDKKIFDSDDDVIFRNTDIPTNLDHERFDAHSSLSHKLDTIDTEWSKFADTTTMPTKIETASQVIGAPMSKSSNINITSASSSHRVQQPDSNKHNLEDWLDSILDD